VELGYGLYNYYAYLYREKIGWWRFLLSLPKGDKEKGLSLLETVRQQGEYSKIEAWYFLIEIYKDEKTTTFMLTKQSLQTLQSLRSSKKPLIADEILRRLTHLEDREFTEEKEFLNAVSAQIGKKQTELYKGLILKYATRNRAVSLSEALHQKYPDNPFFHTLMAGIYHQNHDWDNSLQTAREILMQAQNNPYYSDYLVYQATYLIGESSFFKGEYEEALQKFDEIIASQPQQPSYLLPWSHLRRGTIYNLKGQKEKAVSEYKRVLELKDVHHVHDLAKNLLKNQEKE
jgi:tetratricopeptide (TPR) repeat protein